jgi:hypothetical protein
MRAGSLRIDLSDVSDSCHQSESRVQTRAGAGLVCNLTEFRVAGHTVTVTVLVAQFVSDSAANLNRFGDRRRDTPLGSESPSRPGGAQAESEHRASTVTEPR